MIISGRILAVYASMMMGETDPMQWIASLGMTMRMQL